MGHSKTNRWKGFLLGSIGGVAGIVAMRQYWTLASALAGGDPREKKVEKKGDETQPLDLDEVSLVGKHHEDGESTTGAVGRILYSVATGKEPKSKETRTTLSYLVHWVFTVLVSGVYGAIRGNVRWLDFKGGLALGVALWSLGDELAMPLLGLADGPTAYPIQLHAHGFGAHIAYGLATSIATQSLQNVTS